MDDVSNRRRHREVVGTTSLSCPYCQGGPMMVTRTERVRQLIDRANPRFDPDVLHHEVCAACAATFLVSEDRIRDVVRPPTGETSEPAEVPDPHLADSANQFLEAAAPSRADGPVEVRADPGATLEEAALRAEEAERVRCPDEARAPRLAAETPAEPHARPTAELTPRAPVRATASWGRADVAGTSSSVPVGGSTEVGAGRRSGPVRRRVADRTS